MRRFLKYQRHMLGALLGGVLAVALLVSSVPAEEMAAEEKLKSADALLINAYEMASKARETSDIHLAQKALELINEASALLAEIASIAQDTGNTDLAQAAMNVIRNLMGVINQVIDAAQYIAHTSTDSRTVAAAKEILGGVEEVQNLNRTTIDTALATGAVPGPTKEYEHPETYRLKMPVQEEPHIHDMEPASPI